MESPYADAVRLLLTVAPAVFRNDIFAMKGGTAINLFLRDMPRLSVDIDVVYLPWHVPRDVALREIECELARIASRIEAFGLQARTLPHSAVADCKLIVESDSSQVKIEVNTVFRGTVMSPRRCSLSEKTQDSFGMAFDIPLLCPDEIYASKLVAALDRQHPRDLFDVWHLFGAEGLTDAMVDCFVIYLAWHNRPIHEVLFGNDRNIRAEYERAFVGMTEVSCPLQTLLDARSRLRAELPRRLSAPHRAFLSSLARGEPQWHLLSCRHAADLPAVRWKVSNLAAFRKRRPAEFQLQADMLDTWLMCL